MTRLASINEIDIKKIAIFRALKLGDFLVAVPAFRALRAAFPGAQIDYVGLAPSRELVKRFRQYLSGFVEFAGFPGLGELDYKPRKVLEFFDEAQSRMYDLAIQMHGDGSKSNACVELFGAYITAGYGSPQCYWPNSEWFMEYPETRHEILKHISLMNFLGVPPKGTELEFPVMHRDYQQLLALPEAEALRGRPYICLHSGAASGRPWDAQNFAAVGDICASAGLSVVLTGIQPEQEIAQAVAQQMNAPAVNLCGKTTLGALAALLKHANLFIGNDTGTAHLAVALDVPSVTIFTTADPALWAPLSRSRHIALRADQLPYPQAVAQAAFDILRSNAHV